MTDFLGLLLSSDGFDLGSVTARVLHSDPPQ